MGNEREGVVEHFSISATSRTINAGIHHSPARLENKHVSEINDDFTA